MKNVPTGIFRLKGSSIQEMGKRKGVQNVHQVSLRGGISYPTAYRYIERPEQVEAISLRALYGVLVDGLGLSRKEIAEMKFGEIFESILMMDPSRRMKDPRSPEGLPSAID